MPYLDLRELPERQVFAAMLFPRAADVTHRDEFLAFAELHAPLEPLDGAAPSPLYRVLSPARVSFVEQGKPITNGELAGWVLLIVRMIAEHHPEHRASVSKAAYVVAADTQRHGTKSLDGRMVPADERSVRKAWERYRPAAHLWAAYNLVVQWEILPRAGSEAAVASGGGGTPLEDHLPLLLALAEEMRRFGEGFAPWAKVGPVLAGAETWKVPPDCRLPRIPLDLPPLPEPALRDLRVYEARKRS